MTIASLCGPTCGSQFFVHVFGALALFGSVLAVAILSTQHSHLAHALLLRRIAFWTTLVLILPAWIIMYVGGYWLIGHEGLDENTPGWAEAGIHLADRSRADDHSAHARMAREQAAALGPWSPGSPCSTTALAVAWFFMSGKPASREPPDSGSSPIG